MPFTGSGLAHRGASELFPIGHTPVSGLVMWKGGDTMPRTPSEGTAHSAESSRAVFPGWSWAALVLAVPIAGYIGWGVSGAVDE